jgi:hypothetical protein
VRADMWEGAVEFDDDFWPAGNGGVVFLFCESF